MANSLAAYDAGATFVDTSVYGIGRSSGNVPTEVMAAVFQRLGIETASTRWTSSTWPSPTCDRWPSTCIPRYDGRVAGPGRFHSSFLPQALRAAQEHEISPFRLIAELGTRDPMRLSPELLEAVVTELRARRPPPSSPTLARDRSTPPSVRGASGNRRQAVQERLDGLEGVAARRHLAVALDLVFAPALEEACTTA